MLILDKLFYLTITSYREPSKGQTIIFSEVGGIMKFPQKIPEFQEKLPGKKSHAREAVEKKEIEQALFTIQVL